MRFIACFLMLAASALAQSPVYGVPGGGGGGSGTVTSVSVATANGLQGTVANPTTTPAITLNVDSTHVLPVNTGSASEFLNHAGAYTTPSGGTTNPGICTQNTALDKCIGVSPYVISGSDWSVAFNQAVTDLTTAGTSGTVHGCGVFNFSGSPIDPSGSNALLRVPIVASVGGATNITIKLVCDTQDTTPNTSALSAMTLQTSIDTAGVNFIGGQEAGPAFTAVKFVLDHVNVISTHAVPQINLLNLTWVNAFALNDVILAGTGCTNPVSATGGSAFLGPSISGNYEHTLDRVTIACVANTGLIGEHSSFSTIWVGSVHNGPQLDSGGSGGNGISGRTLWIQHAVNYLLGPSGANPTPVFIADLDIESDPGTGFDIDDPNLELTGFIGYEKHSPNSPLTTNGVPVLSLYNLVASNYNILETNYLYLNGGTQLQLFSDSTAPPAWVFHDITLNNYPLIVRNNSTAQQQGLEIPSGGTYQFDSTTTGGGSIDTQVSRLSAGVVSFDTTTAGNALGTAKAATGTFGTAVTVAGNNVCQSTGTNCPYAPVSNAITSTTPLGSGITSVTCATASCTNLRGTYTVVGGTATTGTIFTLTWPTTGTAYVCSATQNDTGVATAYLGLGHSVATATGMTISAGISVIGTTFNVDYSCQP